MVIKTSIIGNLKNIMSKWFYTEDEVNTLLNGKSDSNHNHDSRYYLKTEVDAIEDTLRLAIESLVGFTASIVESLPQTGSSGVMYLVPNDGGVEQDYYTEYIWTDEEKFEKIGNTAVEVDLSGYATISFVNSALADYVTSDELDVLLDGKADVVHTHSISDVSGLQSSLDGKAGNSVASSSSNGLMSSTDKTKLDGIATGANKTVVDSSLSTTSTNPVQNKIINQELANKAPSSHVHSRLVPTSIPEGADLNDYTTQGSFYCPMNVTAATVSNTPSNQAFHLEVYKATNDSGKGVCQVAYSYRQDNVHIWWRNGYGGNWSEWYEVANKEDIASLNNNKSNINHTHNSLSPTILGANVDFNDYKTEGTYIISWDSVQSATNAPNKTGGRLEVISVQNGVKQIYHNYESSESGLKIWWRNYYPTTNTWFDWQQVVSTKNVSYRQVDNAWDGLPIFCSIKNGFAFLTWKNPFQYLNDTGSIKQTGVYFDLGYVAHPEVNDAIYQIGSDWRLKIDSNGLLQGWVDVKDAWTYGTWIYPTSNTSLPYPDD